MKDTFRVSDLAENSDIGLDKLNGTSENIVQKEKRNLLSVWIGKNNKKILNINMNIASLFLGELYLFYRKMYIEGLIVFILKIIMFILVPYKYLIVIINMILFFITNSLYKSHINRRINKLKTKYSSSKLELECKKRGGTNIWIFLIVLVIELSLTSFYVYKYTNIKNIINKSKNDTPKVTEKKKEKKTEFNGELKITPLEANILDFGFPSYWNMDKSTANYDFDNTKTDASCKVEIGVVKGYNDAKELAYLTKDYYKVNEMTITTVNSIKWYKYRYVNEGTIVYAFSQKKDDVVLYRFTIEQSAPLEECKKIDNKIFKSIKPMGYVEEDIELDVENEQSR